MLDICTGNGATAYLARDQADRRGIRIEIHAIDVAENQPHSREGDDSTINGVQFHSGVAVEATRCRNDYFDLIVGQFAIEYCSIPEAVEELSRIIRKNGSLILTEHHADSATAQRTRHFVDVADIFLREQTIFYRLRKYAELHIGRKRINARKAPQKRQQLMGSLMEADNLSSWFPGNRFLAVTLDSIKNLVNRIHGDPLVRMEEIREFERTVQYYLIRTRGQRDASFDAERMSELASRLRANGLRTVHYEPWFLDGDLFSWTLRKRRCGVE